MIYGNATTRQAGHVAIVDLSGSITVAGGIGLLRNTIQELVAAGHKHVLLSLQNLTYVDSAGMGELVAACTTLRNSGGDLKLVNPSQRVTNVLRMTGLSAIFAVFADEPAALASFGADGSASL